MPASPASQPARPNSLNSHNSTHPKIALTAMMLAASMLFMLLHPAQVKAQSDSDAALSKDVLAIVNGRPIPRMAVESVAAQIVESGQEADQERIIDELINLEVLTQAAEALSLDKNPEIAAALQLQYTQTLANAYLAQKSAEMSFSEEELRAEYDAQTASVDRAEYRASHILLDSLERANEMIAELKDGKLFDALAKINSIDPGGENGGDLGWFQSAAMVPEFSAALEKMEVGDTSEVPVESEFGFHVIKLVDKRDASLPDFDAVKSGLTNLAVRRALAAHVEELRQAAEIQTQ